MKKINQKSWALILLMMVIWIVTACTTPTQYVQKGIYGNDGYENTQTSDGIYSLKVVGNTSSDRERIIKLFIFRAANLAKKENAPYFLTAAETIDLDLNNPQSTTSKKIKHKEYSVFIIQLGFQKVTVSGFVKPLTTEQARKARKLDKPVKKTQVVLRKNQNLLIELSKFLAKQEAITKKKETEKLAKKKTEEKVKELTEEEKELQELDRELNKSNSNESNSTNQNQ